MFAICEGRWDREKRPGVKSRILIHTFVFVVLGLGLLFVGCSARISGQPFNEKGEDGVVGGFSAEEDPMAETTIGIYLLGDGSYHNCTGVFVAADVVLTAAHCVVSGVDYDVQAQPKDIILSKASWQPGHPVAVQDAFYAKSICIHPQFGKIPKGEVISGIAIYDLALLRVPVRAGQRLARRIADETSLLEKTQTRAIGYGIARDQRDLTATYRPQVFLSFIERQLDMRSGEIVMKSFPSYGLSAGDSGGPGFVRFGKEDYLWGIYSRGWADLGEANAFESVQFHSRWLDRALQYLTRVGGPQDPLVIPERLNEICRQ